jgi:hypothetical protein
MKKFFILLVLLFCITSSTVLAQGDPTAVTPPIESSSNTRDFTDDACDPSNPKKGQDCYQLLESIPLQDRVLDSIDTTATGSEGGIGGFLNVMFEIGIGIAGVLGVVMLVIYGFRYAANDKNINEFSKLKEKIGSVILGLLLLLGIFVILNTINPDLLVVEPEIATVNLEISNTVDNFVAGESVGDFKTNNSVPNSGRGFALNGTFENPKPSSASTNLLEANQKLKSKQVKITKLFADVGDGSDTNGKLYIYLSDGLVATAPIRTGWKGVAERGQGVSGDHRTPKGDWRIMERMSIASSSNNAVISNNGKSNFGPAFLNYTPRATGLHGRGDNRLATTEGCLRLYNDDLLLLAPFIYKGLELKID